MWKRTRLGILGVATLTAACGMSLRSKEAPGAAGVPQAAPAETLVASDESYGAIKENAFFAAEQHPLSTFSIDVDTASYSNVRRFLNQGSLPPKDAVRIEELVNYFSYDYPEPKGDEPFSVTSEVSSAPWNTKHRLVHIGLQGKTIPQAQLPARNLVFLLDVSGSMADANKLPLLKRSLRELTATLTEKDRVSIVVYAGASGLVLPATVGSNGGAIADALERLEAGGSTNGGEGIQLAYQMARRAMTPGAINRVILATDGDFNVGVTDQDELVQLIEKARKSGIFLTVLGFGMGNLKDSTLEKLADTGNGNYAYIDSLSEARKVLIEEAGATLVTIAKDVKIQVAFDPSRVSSYRLIGYENRLLQHADFANDQKDAGEIGAGHNVTALYEIVPTAAAGPGHLMTLKLRYKRPSSEQSELVSFEVKDTGKPLEQSSDDFRFSAAVAAFGMLLRDSEHKGGATFELVNRLAHGAIAKDDHGHRRELIGLVDTAKKLAPSAALAR
jgi:Ca-activated chloride channel family protein